LEKLNIIKNIVLNKNKIMLNKTIMKRIFLRINLRKVAITSSIFFSSFGIFSQTNVYDNVIATSSDHTSLKLAIDRAGLTTVLQDDNASYTVFAPDNNAFAILASELNTTVTDLLDLPNLADILTYHVLGTEVLAANVINGATVQPLNLANTLKLTKTTNGIVYANQAMVNNANLTTDNGVVHSINAVVLSDETVIDVAIDNGYTSLFTAVGTAELLPVLTDPFSRFTVFAPDNAAFDNLATALNTDITGLLGLPNLADILTYHVLGSEVLSSAVTNGLITQPVSATNTLKFTVTSGGDVFLNQAELDGFDIAADNGVVHTMDAVVLPYETVVDVAIDNGYSTLVTAVATAELLPVLTNPLASFTVFAPDNTAFDNLATALNTDIAGLLALPNLADILTYHVLGSEVLSSAVTNGLITQPVSTTNTLKFTVTAGGDVYLNQAELDGFDITAYNGVVHTMDAVVLPFETVVDVAIDNGYSTLVTAVATAELLPVLTDPFASLTVFAPDNAAFDNLATALNTNVNGLLGLTNLADILTYHVLGSEVLSSAVTNGLITQPVSTTNTLKFTVTSGGDVFLNQAELDGFDIAAYNGVVHTMDAVVLPTETVVDVAISSGFTSLTTAVVTAELLPLLTDPLADFTVFAPDNTAFDNLATALNTDIAGLLTLPNLADILAYHVIDVGLESTQFSNGTVGPTLSPTNTLKVTVTSGGDIYTNHAKVTSRDNTTGNGIVHVLDAVILPFETVVDVAIDNGYTILTAAIAQQELLPALTNPFAELTVFAPDNAAFDNLAADLNTDIAGLLALPNLTDILLYHVIGSVNLSGVLVTGSVATLNGQDVEIDITSVVMVNDATVTSPDNVAFNGVVHVINKVLVPASTASIEESNLTFAIFPNPSTDFINIAYDRNENAEVRILNTAGIEVLRTSINSSNTLVDVTSLSNGMYVVNIKGQTFETMEKLLIGQ
jgi:uncharacterized surface protein with fasciclin (FAS1) repeats